MSEETNNEGGLSGLKKTIIGTLGTIVTAGGVWLTTQLGGGHSEDKEEVKTEQVAPAPAAAPVVINLQNNNTNQQKQQSGGTHTVVKERVIEKPAAQPSPAAQPAQKESW
jgi:flagellar basal body-associated protein FliL